MPQSETWWDFASFILRTVLTLIAAAILILEANGYVIDFDRLRVEKAGLIVVSVHPTDAELFLNGRQINLQRGQLTQKLFPDLYLLEIRREGYQVWQHSVRVESGTVAAFPGALLFLDHIVQSSQHPVTVSESQLPLINSKILITGNELWYKPDSSKEQLVTRLSVPITAATLLDSHHIVYQTADSVRVIDIDGLNDDLLVSQKFDLPQPMTITEGGRVLEIVGLETTALFRLQ